MTWSLKATVLPVIEDLKVEYFMDAAGDGWWQCPSPLLCEVLDGPAQYRDFRHPFWLVRTDPSIEWHGDPYFWGAEEYPDHPLLHAMEPTPFALVTARQEEPIRPDLGILDGNVPAGPVLPDPEPRHVGEARTVSGLWVKAMIRVSIQS
jgi:hypothetical protein